MHLTPEEALDLAYALGFMAHEMDPDLPPPSLWGDGPHDAVTGRERRYFLRPLPRKEHYRKWFAEQVPRPGAFSATAGTW
jgi:hypothetical protein